MDKTILSFWMTLAGTICWGVCFWWMRRLSIKQNFLLDQLREQGKRIEKLSRLEHDLIKEVQPQVSQIKEGMEEMMAVARKTQKILRLQPRSGDFGSASGRLIDRGKGQGKPGRLPTSMRRRTLRGFSPVPIPGRRRSAGFWIPGCSQESEGIRP